MPDIESSIKRRKSSKHQTSACCSCKKRRRKCDGDYPVCSNCERLGVECTIVYAPTGREIKRDHLERLEKTIEALQVKQQILEQQILKGNSISELPLSNSPLSFSPHISSGLSYPPTMSYQNQDLAQEVGYISLGAAGERHYMGETSAYSIAKVIGNSLNYCTLGDDKQEKDLNELHGDLPYKFPDYETSLELFIRYKNSVQCQYPFLDWKFAETCFDLVIKKKSKNCVANFFLFMIFAIASQIDDSSNTISQAMYTKAYHQNASKYATSVLSGMNIYTVQAFLLMAVYSQKTPDGLSCWQSIGLAIRTAVILGLHRKSSHRRNGKVTEHQLVQQDLHSRIFWSAYGIERINGLVLGRPFSISDVDIDAPFPLETDSTRVACHVVKLRRIQSNISTFIYKPINLLDSPNNMEATRLAILLELNSWMDTFPYKENAMSTFETNNWSLISYHNSILLLLRPIILEIAKMKSITDAPSQYLEWFKVFTESASAICINYKSMYLKKRLSYTWLAMHCCFVSGISFLYCIWLDHSFNILKWKRKSTINETINSCQVILYALAEKWDTATRFRDSFETMAGIVRSMIEVHATDNEEYIVKSSNGYSGYSVFEEGSIGIDSFLTGRELFEKVEQGGLLGGKTEGITNICESKVAQSHQEVDDFDSLWDFINITGDRYMRDLFVEMEDSFNVESTRKA